MSQDRLLPKSTTRSLIQDMGNSFKQGWEQGQQRAEEARRRREDERKHNAQKELQLKKERLHSKTEAKDGTTLKFPYYQSGHRSPYFEKHLKDSREARERENGFEQEGTEAVAKREFF